MPHLSDDYLGSLGQFGILPQISINVGNMISWQLLVLFGGCSFEFVRFKKADLLLEIVLRGMVSAVSGNLISISVVVE